MPVNTDIVYITLMAVNPETTVRKLVSLPKTMVQEIDDFRFQERIKTEAEAIRQLIALGLEVARTSDRKADAVLDKTVTR